MTGDRASGSVVERLGRRVEAIADAMVETYRLHISDYDRLASPEFDRDVRTMSLTMLTSLLSHLDHGRLLDDEELAEIRASGARRVHQGVPLDALLHAYRLWGEVAWHEIVTETTDDAGQGVAMLIAGRLIQQVNLVSTELARGYLAELEGVRSDRDALTRELVEVLVTAPEDRERALRLAEAGGVRLADGYGAVVAGLATESATGRLDRAAANRRAISVARRVAGSRSIDSIVTVRHEHIVALVAVAPAPAPHGEPLSLARELAAELAPLGYLVTVGGVHRGPDAARTTYREATEALNVAAPSGPSAAPVEFDRILVDAILRGSPLTPRLVAAVIEPLRRYDHERAGELGETLTAYIDSGFSIAGAARRSHAHANTVVYRLQKIHEITGYDPRRPDDLVALVVAVRANRALGD